MIAITVFVIIKFVPLNADNKSKAVNTSNDKNVTEKKSNNKIVIVKNLKIEYLKKAIQQFIDLNKKSKYVIKPKVTILNDHFVITFPYDIEFETLCYFINYLEYAHDLSLKPDYKPEIFGWYKTKNGDKWMTNDIINKEVLLFIPETDDEYDNVYITTQDNLGFKMGFALGYAHEKLEKPAISFIKRPIHKSDLKNYEWIEFLE